MTAAAITAAKGARAGLATAACSRDRRWALRWSYLFLVLFAILFLTPPFYMLITSLKIERGDSGGRQPLVGRPIRRSRTMPS